MSEQSIKLLYSANRRVCAEAISVVENELKQENGNQH